MRRIFSYFAVREFVATRWMRLERPAATLKADLFLCTLRKKKEMKMTHERHQ